ncbi:class I SAM-dependent methyltransferase [Paenibacillus sp. strain BS8-2]
MNEIFDAAKWEQTWKDDPYTAVNKMKSSGMDPTRSFDSKAAVFNKEVFSEDGKKRTNRIISWIEGQNVDLRGMSVLDIGAASGGFSVAFAERGAKVTAVEPNGPLAELFIENARSAPEGTIELVREPFENIDLAKRGWLNKFDLVFVSMCPVINDWESTERLLSCAKQFCYLSMPAGSRENSLMNEIAPIVSDKPIQDHIMEFGYLMHLLYLKGYTYESIVSRELKTTKKNREEALKEMLTWLRIHGLPADERSEALIKAYLEKTYSSETVEYQEGGRFGKVLVRLRDQQMYIRSKQRSAEQR